MSADFAFVGLDEFIKEFQLLTDTKTQNKIFKKATNKALTEVVLPDVKSNAPVGKTGSLEQGFSVITARRRGEVGSSIASSSDSPYALQVETGHKQFSLHGEVVVPPKPYLRPAFDKNEDRLLQNLADNISDDFDKIERQVWT